MKRSEFITAVKSVMSGVEKSGNVLGMDYLIFDDLWIRSFRDEISVSYPLTSGLKGAAKAEELFKVVSKMSGEELKVEIIEEKLTIEDGATLLKLSLLRSEQLDLALERIKTLKTDTLEWFYIPKGFIEGLKLCASSAGTDPSLGYLGGVHFDGARVISTDNYRVSEYIMEEAVPKIFTLPTSLALGFLKIDTQFETIALDRAWLHLTNKEGAIFSARLMSSDYPIDKISGVFEVLQYSKETTGYTLPEGLEKVLDRVEILASGVEGELESLSQITLTYTEGYLILQASKDIGEIVDSIPWDKNHPPEGTTMKMSPDFLKSILGVTRTFQLSPTKKAIFFMSPKFRHLMIAKMEG